MKLSQFRDVLAVAEHGSLRAAGRHLRIAQPAITRSIRDIENELGAPLFERHAKGARLTEIGHAFVRRARAIQEEVRRTSEEIEQIKGRTTGEVTIAMSSASIIALLPRVQQAFRQRFPDALLKISESLFLEAEQKIMNGTLDLYIGPISEPDRSPKVLAEPLFHNERVVIARRNHPLMDAKRFEDLMDAQWVDATLALSTSGIPSEDIGFESWFEDIGAPKPKVVVNAQSAMIAMLTVAHSDLLAILPRQWLEYEPTAAQVSPLKNFKPLSAPSIYVARRRDLPLTPMAEHLSDLVVRISSNYAERHPVTTG